MHYLRESIPPKGLFTHRCEGNGKGLRSPDATNVVTMIVTEFTAHPAASTGTCVYFILRRKTGL